ncbi:hypothetical protein FI667_g1988, partial [Globisporangium splendens]
MPPRLLVPRTPHQTYRGGEPPCDERAQQRLDDRMLVWDHGLASSLFESPTHTQTNTCSSKNAPSPCVKDIVTCTTLYSTHDVSENGLTALCVERKVEREMASRVERIEQQMDVLPPQWEQFAGKPVAVSYYGTKINTFRENPALQPEKAYMQFAVQELKQQMAPDGVKPGDAEVEEIIAQEWQTNMTRCVLETRLNRHRSKDGPVVRRSASGVLSVTDQPKPGENFVLDAIATPIRRKKSA